MARPPFPRLEFAVGALRPRAGPHFSFVWVPAGCAECFVFFNNSSSLKGLFLISLPLGVSGVPSVKIGPLSRRFYHPFPILVKP